jgi:hypothetical protein
LEQDKQAFDSSQKAQTTNLDIRFHEFTAE